MATAADRRPALVALALIVLVLVLAPPLPADAATAAKVCRSSVALRNTPGGFTVGYLQRGDRVRRLRSGRRGWARVDTALRVRGWIPSRALCRA
jgi:hypothetical protein